MAKRFFWPRLAPPLAGFLISEKMNKDVPSFTGLSADELAEGSSRKWKKSEIEALYALRGDKEKGKGKPRK